MSVFEEAEGVAAKAWGKPAYKSKTTLGPAAHGTKITVNGIEYVYLPKEAFNRDKGLYISIDPFQGNHRFVGEVMENLYNNVIRPPKADNRRMSETFTKRPAWAEAKLIAEILEARLPTNFEWVRARKYARQLPELEESMCYERGHGEWVDMLIDLNSPVPVAITGSVVEKEGAEYGIYHGTRTVLANLPRKSGYVIEWDENELPREINPSYEYRGSEHYFVAKDGLRAVSQRVNRKKGGLYTAIEVLQTPGLTIGKDIRLVIDE